MAILREVVMRRVHGTWIPAVVLAVIGSTASAQSNSLFGNSGVNSSRGTSSGGLGASGQGASGQGGFGGGNGSPTGFLGEASGSGTGFTSGATGATGFVGGTNTGFTGNRNATNSTTGMGSGLSNGAGGGRAGGGIGGGQSFGRNGGNSNFGRNGGNRNNGFGNNGFGNGNARGAVTAASRAVRPQQRVAFTFPQRAAEQVKASVSAELIKMPHPAFKTLEVQVDGEGTATLTGTVADEDSRKLAEALVLTEPGVRSVNNELTLSSESPPAQP
jgi:hypothetical protein